MAHRVSTDTRADGGKPSSVCFGNMTPVRRLERAKKGKGIKAVWVLKSHFLSVMLLFHAVEHRKAKQEQSVRRLLSNPRWGVQSWTLPPSGDTLLSPSLCLTLSPPSRHMDYWGFKKDMNYVHVHVQYVWVREGTDMGVFAFSWSSFIVCMWIYFCHISQRGPVWVSMRTVRQPSPFKIPLKNSVLV